jgi:hypothetical protein
MSSHKKRRKSKRAKRTSKSSPPPDLRQIVDALHDAYCLVWTAHKVIVEGHYGPEEGALRFGVEALKRVCEQLDEAESELSRCRKGKRREVQP